MKWKSVSRHNLVLILVLITGLGLTLLISRQMDDVVSEAAERRFRGIARDQASFIQARLDNIQQQLRVLQRTFQLALPDSVDNFAFLTAPYIDTGATLALALRVRPDDESAFVEKVRESLHPDYRVFPEEGGQRDRVPIIHMASRYGDRAAIGFDLASERTRQRALRLAADSADLTVSGRLQLVTDGQQSGPSVLVAAALYQTSTLPADWRKRRELVTGFVVSGLRLEALLPNEYRTHAAHNYRLRIARLDDDVTPLYDSEGFSSSPELFQHTETLHFADQLWVLDVQATPMLMRAISSQIPVWVNFTGLLFFGVLGLYLRYLIRTRQHIENVVEERTRALSHAHAQLDAVLNAATQVSIIVTDLHGTITLFNRGAENLLGYSADEVVGRVTPVFIHDPEEVSARAAELAALLGRSVSGFDTFISLLGASGYESRIWTYRHKSGAPIKVSLIVTRVNDEHGEQIGYLGVAVDISERERILGQLRERDALLAKLSVRVPGMIYQYEGFPDGHGAFPYVSEGIHEVYELAPSDVAQSAELVFARLHPDDLAAVTDSIEHSAQTLTLWQQEYRVILPSRGLRWLRGEAMPERTLHGSVLWHGYLSDITSMKLVEEDLRRLSVTDPLTGVWNRRYFQTRLQHEVERSRRSSKPFALVMADIDHFKWINDQFGHDMGDGVLKGFCELLGKRLRKSDLLCRLGGEEFIVLCPDTDLAQALKLAEDLHRVLNTQDIEPVGRVTASFGVAVWQPEDDAQIIFKRADEGVYKAKAEGRNRISVDHLPLDV